MVGLLSAGGLAVAYPEASPWGAADPRAAENCASCHYDFDPVFESETLSIDGLPETIEPGRRYPIDVRFAAEGAKVTGFQLVASAGTLDSDDADVETIGAAGRSRASRSLDAEVHWPMTWQAPADGDAVTFALAASAANDDQSPFGDTIHFRRYELATVDKHREEKQ